MTAGGKKRPTKKSTAAKKPVKRTVKKTVTKKKTSKKLSVLARTLFFMQRNVLLYEGTYHSLP